MGPAASQRPGLIPHPALAPVGEILSAAKMSSPGPNFARNPASASEAPLWSGNLLRRVYGKLESLLAHHAGGYLGLERTGEAN